MDSVQTPAPSAAPAKSEPLTLKTIETNQRRYLNRGKKTVSFRAKVESINGAGIVLADETGTMNSSAEEGVAVKVGSTYDLTGKLQVENFRLSVRITVATLSANPITSVGAAKLSANLLDAHSAKPIITINQLPEIRIGQSFFAVLRSIERSEGKVNVVLSDNTSTIQAEIIPNKKWISTETLDALNEKAVYLCSDVVLDLNATNQLVARFNHRSKITESNEVAIKAVSLESLSSHAYDDETERKTLKETIHLVLKSERPPRATTKKQQKQQKHKEQQQLNQQARVAKEKKPRKNPIPSSSPVTIDNLLPWNRNQSFYGKILSLTVVKPSEPKSKATFLKGQAGDSTGVVDFDLIQKKKQAAFEVGQVVLFDKAMNKGTKEGKHYIEVKRFGSYTVVEDHVIEKVNTVNNLSEKQLPEAPPRVERPVKVKEPKAKKQVQPHEPLVPGEPVKINQLIARSNKQSIIGKVLRVSEETRQNKDNEEQVHLVGAIADETGSVDFDILKKDDLTLRNNDVVKLDLVVNRIQKDQFIVKILKHGSYVVLQNVKLGNVNTDPVTPLPQPPKEKKAPVAKKVDQSSAQQTPGNERQNRARQNQSSERGNRTSSNNKRAHSQEKSNGIPKNNNQQVVKGGQSNNKNNSAKANGQQKNNNGNTPNHFNDENNGQSANNRGNRHKSVESQPRNNNNNRSNNNRNNNNVNNNNNAINNNRNNRTTNNNNNNNNRSSNNNNNNNNSNNRSSNNNNNNFNNTNNNNRSNNNNNNSYNFNNTNNNNRSNNNNTKPQSADNGQRYQRKQQEEENLELTKVKELFPGQHGQNIQGVVFEVKEFQETYNGKSVTSIVGRIADDTANISFNFNKKKYVPSIKNGQVYTFKNLMNKVNDDSFHFITIGKYGRFYESSTRIQRPNKGDGDNNLSTMAYETKQVNNDNNEE